MSYKYLNRDISWLYFNYRVLEEAADLSLPVYERLKFLAIYSNNLEEFYRVRLSYYRRLLRELPEDHPKIKETKPAKIIAKINFLVAEFEKEFTAIFENTILPELEANNIRLLEEKSPLTEKQEKYVKNVFDAEILPYIQPVVLLKKKVKPFIRTGEVYVAVHMKSKSLTGLKKQLLSKLEIGLLKLPTNNHIGRFIMLPEDADKNHCIMFIEDVMMKHINEVFPGYNIKSWYSIKVTRDADLEYEDYESEELIDIIQTISTTRQLGLPNRFLYDAKMPHKIVTYFSDSFDLDKEDLVAAGVHHNFNDFFSFPNPKSPELEVEVHKPMLHPEFQSAHSVLKYVEKNEVMLHFPYQSYNYFLKYLTEAAYDESVTEIKATQYRVAVNSAVVRALILAARNGKKVTVFVELKARFDEENNLKFAKEMKRAGIDIIYSLPGLKVHAKIAMVTRVNSKGITKKSAFLATGNFNEKTAETYCDHGFFTPNPEITVELEAIFSMLESKITSYDFKHLLVPNNNMVERLEELIRSEIQNAKKGERAYIILKMNAIEDPYMINLLYEASIAGVKIDIIVRGAACVKVNRPYSENIRLIRIVDRFLEHARIFYFYNAGEENLYMSSADWMKRNLHKRIECAFPIYDSEIKREVLDILYIQLADNVKASFIDENMENNRIPTKGKAVRAQVEIYNYLKQKYSK